MIVTPEAIDRMSLWEFGQMYKGFLIINGEKDDAEKAPSKKRLEQVYKDIGIWYPEIFDESDDQ